MNESERLVLNCSSIIDLKAELYRKQELFRSQKLSRDESSDQNQNCNKKYKLGKRVREKAVQHKQQTNDLLQSSSNKRDDNEEKALKKSREMLEKKCKLYDELCRNGVNYDENDDEYDDRVLVNFEQKAIERRLRDDGQRSDDNEDNWTEFVDSLGRTRKCLRKDLPYFEKLDRDMSVKSISNSDSKRSDSDPTHQTVDNCFDILSPNNELLSDDLKRELDRREWEESANDALNDGPIHYQNVQFSEVRDHGVAYFQFDKDDTHRRQQMDTLNNLREQTKKQTLVKHKIKEKRKQLMRERLTKIAQRKGIKVEFPESSESSDSESEAQAYHEPHRDHRDLPISVPKTIREWDIGKEELDLHLSRHRSTDNYMVEKRNERNMDFAPPPTYFENRDVFKSNQNRLSKRPELESKNFKSNLESYDEKNVNSSSTKPDVQQLIGDALSFFRNNAK